MVISRAVILDSDSLELFYRQIKYALKDSYVPVPEI